MHSSLTTVIANNVRAERSRRRWTQGELAQRLGWGRGTLSHLEQGRRQISVDDLLELCRALGVSAAVLLDGATEADRVVLGV